MGRRVLWVSLHVWFAAALLDPSWSSDRQDLIEETKEEVALRRACVELARPTLLGAAFADASSWLVVFSFLQLLPDARSWNALPQRLYINLSRYVKVGLCGGQFVFV